MTTLPDPPPIRGDHRQTWLGIAIVVALLVAVIVVAAAVAP